MEMLLNTMPEYVCKFWQFVRTLQITQPVRVSSRQVCNKVAAESRATLYWMHEYDLYMESPSRMESNQNSSFRFGRGVGGHMNGFLFSKRNFSIFLQLKVIVSFIDLWRRGHFHIGIKTKLTWWSVLFSVLRYWELFYSLFQRTFWPAICIKKHSAVFPACSSSVSRLKSEL